MSRSADEYRTCVEAWAATSDGIDRASIRRGNRAVDQMREIVRRAEEQGTVLELVPLLDEPACARWLAYQLVEMASIDKALWERCIGIVEKDASRVDVNGLGARMWLKEWRTKREASSSGP